MITAMISRLMILAFGMLYPAYASYKAVRTRDVREYVKWMMYWIVFALFTCAETFTDVLFSFWFPFYYEIKVALIIWLLSPATKGSSFLYRNFVHPALQRRESEIDEMLNNAKEKGYNTVLSIGSRSVSYATNVLLQTAMRTAGQVSWPNGGDPSTLVTSTSRPPPTTTTTTIIAAPSEPNLSSDSNDTLDMSITENINNISRAVLSTSPPPPPPPAAPRSRRTRQQTRR